MIGRLQGVRNTFPEGARIRGYDIDVNRHTNNCTCRIGQKITANSDNVEELLAITDQTLYQGEFLFKSNPPQCFRFILKNSTPDNMLIQMIFKYIISYPAEKIVLTPIFGEGAPATFTGDQINKMLNAWKFLTEQTNKDNPTVFPWQN